MELSALVTSSGRRVAATHVDALVGETRRYGRGLLFGFAEKNGEPFDGRHGDITAVVSGKDGLKAWCVRVSKQ